MVSKLKFAALYFSFWLLYFFLVRLIFISYNYQLSLETPFNLLLGSFWHGIKLDVSMTGYLSFFILLFLSISTLGLGSFMSMKIKGFTYFFVVLFSIINISDAELYRNWGFKMDNTIFLYLKTPGEAMASTNISTGLLLVFLMAALSTLSIIFYNKFIHKHAAICLKLKWPYFFVFFILAASMIIPIRGGFGIAPINTGTVYFSNNQYANHAAVNTCWNLGQSAMQMGDEIKVSYMPEEEALELIAQMNAPRGETLQLIDKKDPNILIIILESFTSNIIEPLGGMHGVAPNFNALSKEGVLFTNFIANGDRSDKGIASILSGYPAQPTTSVIKYNAKSGKLPHLSLELMDKGYSSAFYYGGELNFANMQAYFLNGKYEELITLKNFDTTNKGKWGAHDEEVFHRLWEDLEKPAQKPFFKVFFTLSSHDPFDVPFKGPFDGSDEESRYLNSANYTDSCLGDFMQKAKNSDWYENTWIILLADHGNRLPGNIAYNTKNKFEIPMLWLGGALGAIDTSITAPLNQNDLPLMVANQLGYKFDKLSFSKDILNGAEPYSFFVFNNGYGYYNQNNEGYTWDLETNKLLHQTNGVNTNDFTKGKALIQSIISDFNQK